MATGCTRQTEYRVEDIDTTDYSDYKRPPRRGPLTVSNTYDTIDLHYEKLLRDFSNLETVRKEHDKVMADMKSREEAIKEESSAPPSEGFIWKKYETQTLFELQQLEDACNPKLLKIEDALNGTVELTKPQLRTLMKEARDIIARQIEIAEELEDDKLTKSYQDVLSKLSEAEEKLQL